MSNEIPDFDLIDAAASQLAISNNVVPITTVDEPSNEPEIETAEILAPILGIGFNTLAPNWKITPEEINQLSQAYGALLDKYLPDTGLDKFGAEISAVMVTAMIIMPRMAIPRKDKKIEKPKKTDREIKMEPLKDAS